MSIIKTLKLYGAIEYLGNALAHIGKNQRTNDWDGRYMDLTVEAADCILRKALWDVEFELRKVKSGK